MWSHQYAGLPFVLSSFPWALSGALSLTPWEWSPSTGPTPSQRAAMSRGALAVSGVDDARSRQAVSALALALAPPNELELVPRLFQEAAVLHVHQS